MSINLRRPFKKYIKFHHFNDKSLIYTMNIITGQITWGEKQEHKTTYKLKEIKNYFDTGIWIKVEE